MKKIILLLFILTNLQSFSQIGTGSPYSFIGFGETNFKGNHLNRAMGGIDVYIDSIHPNIKNPSSYGALKATTYSVGVNYRQNNIEDEINRQKITSSSIDYIGVSIPTKRFGFGFGILPYSSVGYLLEDLNENDQTNKINRFTGEGGLNQAFLNVGFKVIDGLNLGISSNYGFGDITYRKSQVIEGVSNGTYSESNSSLSGISFKFSANITIPIKKLQFYTMLGYIPEAKLTSRNIEIIYTRSIIGGLSELGDIEETDLKSSGLDETYFTIPKAISIGFGIGKNKKWFVGGQLDQVNSTSFKNQFINQPNVSYQKSNKISAGGFYIPEFSSITSYWKRVVYRFGFRSENKGYLINNHSIKENGITFGVGLPMAGYSNTNVTFEFGQLGTKKNNLIRENFWALRLGFSLNDIWFIKRKYN
ncbi:MAG: hypothetical protein CMC79_04960 [Flavobacteriaceae bacterium]|nr:hypothetical protein [Flavobacteriaceae bacterium]